MRLLLPCLGLALLAADTEEPPPDLPVVRAESVQPQAAMDSIPGLLQTAANPNLPDSVSQQAFASLVQRGETAVPQIAELFHAKDSTDFECWVAARVLGRVGGAPAVAALKRGLDSKRITTRLGAISGLHLLKDRSATAQLEAALTDPALTVRAAAADALGDLAERKSWEPLSKALNLPGNFHQGQSLFVREHIVDALGKVGSIGGIDALIGVLDESDGALKLHATRALARITGLSFRDPALGAELPPPPAEVDAWKAWWQKRKAADRYEQRTIGG